MVGFLPQELKRYSYYNYVRLEDYLILHTSILMIEELHYLLIRHFDIFFWTYFYKSFVVHIGIHLLLCLFHWLIHLNWQFNYLYGSWIFIFWRRPLANGFHSHSHSFLICCTSSIWYFLNGLKTKVSLWFFSLAVYSTFIYGSTTFLFLV